MSDNNSPWGPKPGSGNNGGKGDGNSPWGNGGGQRPNKPQRPSRDNVIEGFKSRTGRGGGGGNRSGGNGQLPEFNIPSWAFLLVPLVLLAFTSVFTVQGNQEAAILRFGDYQRTVGPGLHFKWPNPVEKKYVRDVTNQRETLVGVRNNAESLMLTGDENIVDIISLRSTSQKTSLSPRLSLSFAKLSVKMSLTRLSQQVVRNSAAKSVSAYKSCLTNMSQVSL
jgi:membrane protease subunit HflK